MSNDKRTVGKRSNKKAIDARVRRTRDALGDALIALMQTQSFESITVQNVLDRARISRSTFYKHFSDKNDLFMSDVDELFEFFATTLTGKVDASDRVFPVTEFFTHVREMKPLLQSLIDAGKLSDNLQLAQRHFARGIEQRLIELPRSKATSIEQRPAIAFAYAGALISLLMWWIDREMSESPKKLDNLYHKIFWEGVGNSSSRDLGKG